MTTFRVPSLRELRRVAANAGYTVEPVTIGYNEGYVLAHNGIHTGVPTYKIETAYNEMDRIALAILNSDSY